MRKRKLPLVSTTFSLLVISQFTLAQSPNWQWARRMGGTANDVNAAAVALAVTVDATGNVYTTGYFNGTVDFDPGIGVFNLSANSNYYSGIFISKIDASGNFVWARSMGGTTQGNVTGGGNGYAITIDVSDNIYTAGTLAGTVDFDPGPGVFNLTSHASQDVFISKLDNAGNFQWAKAVGGTWYSYVSSLAVDASGNVYSTGIFAETADFDPGAGVFNLTSPNYNTFISKLDNSGNFVWAKALGGGSIDCYSSAIAVDGVGNVFTTGRFIGTGDFDPGAAVYNFNAARSDIYISKLDNAGNFVWAKQMIGTDIGETNSVKVDATGNIYIAGSFGGTIDFNPGPEVFNLTSSSECVAGTMFISKLDNAGNFIWVKVTGGTGCSTTISLALDGSGNIYTAGNLRDTVDFDPGVSVFNLICPPGSDNDIFITKYNNDGNFTWAKSVRGTGNEHSGGIAVNSAGDIFVAGNFQNPSISFDSLTLVPTNANDNVFIAKLNTSLITGISGMGNLNKNALVFPNPVSTSLTIALGDNKKATVTITDISGKISFIGTFKETKKIEISTEHFLAGTYVVQITGADFIITKKIIVIR